MSYHLFPTDDELPEDMGRDEVDAVLDAIDAAWVIDEAECDRVHQKFLRLLAEREPNHPWVTGPTTAAAATEAARAR